MLTANVASWIYTKLIAVILVQIHTVGDCVGDATVAFFPIDCFNSCPESLPGCNSSMAIAIYHPKPDSSLPRDWVILSYDRRVIQSIEAQVISCCAIIIIPAKVLATTQQMVGQNIQQKIKFNKYHESRFIIILNGCS